MKRLIPVFTAIVLIFIVLGVGALGTLKEKYSYSKEEADLNSYYGLTDDTQVAIVLNEEIQTEKALMRDGAVYLPYDFVSDYFVATRFYVNQAENSVRYVLPDRILSWQIGEAAYVDGDTTNQWTCPICFYDGDTFYLAVDFLRQFKVFDYASYTEPNRLVLHTSYDGEVLKKVKKDTAVRLKGGVKSEILTKVSAGDQLVLLDEMENWSAVATADGFIGYVENKFLEDSGEGQRIFADNSAVYGGVDYHSQTRDHKVVMAWHQVFSYSGVDELDQMVAGTQSLNVISPTWFYLNDTEGGIGDRGAKDYVDKAHGKGLEVWALLEDVTVDLDEELIFGSAANRQTLIQNLMSKVDAYGLDGINLDIEKIRQETGPDYMEFIREISIPCRQRGIVLSVDNYPPVGGRIYYNWSEQGVFADYVVLMSYDEHYGGGEAGSVSSLGYTQSSIEDMAKYVPQEKLIQGLPFYTRIWTLNGTETMSKAVGMREARNYADSNGLTITWDDATCQNFAELVKESNTYQIWLEDAESISAKLGVCRNYNIAGLSFWKIGMETPDVWPVIAEYAQE